MKDAVRPDPETCRSSPWLAELDCPAMTNTSPTPTCGILQGLAQDILKVGVVRGVANRVKIVVRHVKLQGKRAIGGLSRDILMAKI